MVTIPREAFHASLRSTFRVVGNPAAIKGFLSSWARASTSSRVSISWGGEWQLECFP